VAVLTPGDLGDLDGRPRPAVGVVGGSGLYELLDGARAVEVETPWGPPSGPVMIGEVAGRPVAFLARHGAGHRHPAHLVNYRANVWALRSVGVRRLLAPGAVGSLRPDLAPGSFVVPDQVVDRTRGRAGTFADRPGGACHVPFADPYCPELREALLSVAGRRGLDPVAGGTMVVISGPRFSSRAESRWHAAQGWSVVGMTGMPEAALAREQALCYAAISVVTDLDAGVHEGQGVTQAEVLATFAVALERLRGLLLAAVAELPAEATGCWCRHALDGLTPTYPVA
jgi:5'-methylthioadenosine phosphorylase